MDKINDYFNSRGIQPYIFFYDKETPQYLAALTFVIKHYSAYGLISFRPPLLIEYRDREIFNVIFINFEEKVQADGGAEKCYISYAKPPSAKIYEILGLLYPGVEVVTAATGLP